MPESRTLGDICLKIIDCEHKTAPAAANGTEFGYLVGTPNIRGGRMLLDGAKRVDRATYDLWTKRGRPREGDIILTREAPVGEAAFVDGLNPVCLGQRTVLLRPDVDQVAPRYLHYLLLSPTLQERMHAQAEGSTVPHLNVSDIRGLRIGVLPSLPEQRAVAAVLGALDDKIAVNERIASTYEQLLRLRFDQLRVDVEPASKDAMPLAELIEFNPALPMPKANDTVYVDMAAVPTASARIQEWSRREPKPGTRFQNGDTVMARITPCLENGKTAFVDFMGDGEIGVGSTEFIVLRAREGVPVHFLYFLARSARFRGYAIQNMVGSSGRQRVSAEVLAQFTIARPDYQDLHEFGRSAAVAFRHMKWLDMESRCLKELRDTLLPGLMSGAIRVRDAEKAVEDAR